MVGNQELDLPEKTEIERTTYTYLPVYVLLDGTLIEEKTTSANKSVDPISEPARDARGSRKGSQ